LADPKGVLAGTGMFRRHVNIATMAKMCADTLVGRAARLSRLG
jgi:hypothetical protein